MMMDEGQDRVRASYRDNYERLAQIKGRCDEDNTFRVNQNIRPPETPPSQPNPPAADSTRQARHGHIAAVTCAALEREGELAVHRP